MFDGYLANEKTRIEIEKIKLDVEKTRVDIENSKHSISLERLKAYGGLSGNIVALAALLTISWNIYVFSVDSGRKARDAFSLTLSDLTSDSAQKRGIASLSLSAYLKDPAFRDMVISALSYSLTTERDLQAQKAIIKALAGAEEQAASRLSLAREEIKAEIIPLFDNADPRPEDRGPEYLSDQAIKERSAVAQQIQAKQYALVNTSIALTDLSLCHETRSNCYTDLSHLPLKGFKFVGLNASLRGANFEGSSLWKADLFGIDLTFAKFVDSQISSSDFRKANLTKADFTGANASYADDPSEKRARFQEADISDARFDRACLSGADFTKVRGASVLQFKDAFAFGASFDKDFLKLLKEQKAYNEGPSCKK